MNRMKWIKWILGIIVLLIVVGAAYVYLHAEAFVADAIKKSMPENVALEHGEIVLDILQGNVLIKDIDLDIKNGKDNIEYAFIHLNQIEIEGFSYWRFLFDRTIHLDKIKLSGPFSTIYPALKLPSIESDTLISSKFNRTLNLDHFVIANGQIVIMQDNMDSVKYKATSINVDLFKVKSGSDIVNAKIPFLYKNLNLSASNLFVDLGVYEKLTVDHLKFANDKLTVTDLSIRSKYSKAELLKVLQQEREHLAIGIPDIQLDSVNYGFNNNQFYIGASTMKISDANMVFHLDKRLKDRTKIKPMYSKLFRELPFDLSIDTLKMGNSKVSYEEKKDKTVREGVIYFDKLDAEVYNLSNMYPIGQFTEIYATARIMGESDVELDWRFDVNSERDVFTMAGSVSDFDASSVNQFLDANIKTTATGQVDQLYFTVSGDDKYAWGDMKIKYNSLKLHIQKENRSGKHKLKSWIGNLMVNSGKSNDDEGYRHGKIAVARNRQKPFFNFLWLNVKDGLLNSVKEKRRRK